MKNQHRRLAVIVGGNAIHRRHSRLLRSSSVFLLATAVKLQQPDTELRCRIVFAIRIWRVG